MEKRTYAIRMKDKTSDVSGYVFDSGIDYYIPILIGVDNRNGNGRWYITDLNTGLSFGGWFPTRKAAIEAYEKTYKTRFESLAKKSISDEKEFYSRMIKEFDSMLGVRK